MPRSISKANRKKAVSAIIGAILLFAMLITVGSTYFYVIAQDQKTLQNSISQNQNNFQDVQSQERLSVYGVSQSGELAFYVNNTGIGVSITSYWILNQTAGTVLEYCPSPPALCSGTLVLTPASNPSLPLNLGQGQSRTFNDTNLAPAIIMPATGKYVIKVITKEGTTSIGTYPSQQLTATSVNSLVAGGFGFFGDGLCLIFLVQLLSVVHLHPSLSVATRTITCVPTVLRKKFHVMEAPGS